jgi:hypothetical protein
MALVVKDRVRVTTTTTGTSDFTIGSAALGFQNFSVIGDGNETYYAAVDTVTGSFEVGIGTFTAAGPTLTRTTILESSAAGAKVSFGAGSKDLFVTYPAERSVYLDIAGSYPVQNTFNALNATTATLTNGTVSTTPASGTDIANKTYVDTVAAQSITYHAPVFVESPSIAGNLNATYNNGASGVGATLTNAGTQAALTIDGVLMTTTKRVLIYSQTNAAQNGVYTVTVVGTGATNWVLTRATDADTYAVNSPTSLGQGDAFFVTNGDTGAGELYVMNTVGVITFGTTAINFTQISSSIPYIAGTGLNLSPSTTFNISNVGTAGTYGSSSNVPVFVTNAQGQVTSVTNTGIAITSAAVSGLAASATTDTTNAANISSGTLPSGRISGSYTGLTGTGALAAGSLASGFTAVSAPLGGTGQTSYAVGDLIYANTTTSLAKLADVAVGNALISGGVSAAPSWGKVGLATHVSGTLPVANGGTGVTSSTGTGSTVLNTSPTLVTPVLGTPTSGTLTNCTGYTSANLSGTVTAPKGGTGQTSYAVGDLLYASTSIDLSRLADVATGNSLISGGVGVAPSWGKIGLTTHVSGTLPVANGGTGVTSSTGTGSTVLNTSPTLVTPVLGTPTSGTLTNCTDLPIDAGTSGTLPVLRGGTGVTSSTGTGSTVLNTSPTLVTPALGTPSALVGTNITGTAAGFSIGGNAGTVTNGVYTDAANVLTAALTLQGIAPIINFFETDQTLPAGRRRLVENGNQFSLRRNTAVGGDFSTEVSEFLISATGDFTGIGNITAYSDIRLKKDLVQIPDALEKVRQLTGYTYTRIDTGEKQTGLVAQDVQKVLPEAVLEGEHLSLAYGNLVGLLVEAIKELEVQVAELRAAK